MTESQGVHVVFGAGQVGPELARRLAASGKAVRVVRRSAATLQLSGVKMIRADALDPKAVAEAARGAEAIYHCINAAYSSSIWNEQLPKMQKNLVETAGREGARLVVLDNVYALGKTGGAPRNEETPLNPCSKKGEIRARLFRNLEEHVKRGDVRAVVGLASDFYGPGGVWTGFSDRFWPNALAGKTVRMLMSLDQPHTYHYIPDVAAGLAVLGLDSKADGVFMLPCRPAVTTREMVARFAEVLGRPITLSTIPRFLLQAISLVVPILREALEMGYQWEEPFVIDDAKFRGRFGEIATPEEAAARATVEWGKAAYGPGRAIGSES